MSVILLEGVPQIEVQLRRSARARRLSLRVSRLDGRVTLTVPHGVSERQVHAFAKEKAGWLRGALEGQPDAVDVELGVELPLAGHLYRLVKGQGRSVRLVDDHLHIPGAADATAAKVAGFLKAQARARLQTACAGYADDLGRPFGRITLRDTRSRWGSCSSEGNLNFSWRLAMAPPEVLNYVAAHEVAHLAEMNHSRRFWDVVTRLYGSHDAERRWLRTEGAALHRYRFRN